MRVGDEDRTHRLAHRLFRRQRLRSVDQIALYVDGDEAAAGRLNPTGVDGSSPGMGPHTSLGLQHYLGRRAILRHCGRPRRQGRRGQEDDPDKAHRVFLDRRLAERLWRPKSAHAGAS